MTEQQTQPLISIDVVPLRFNRGNRQVEVALAKRIFEPSLGAFALPGVLLLSNELLEDAVQRALRDKVGLMAEHARAFGDVGVFDTPGRDPRGPTLSITKYCIAGDGYTPGDGAAYFPLSEAAGLPFDHDLIIKRAARVVHDRLWVDIETTRELIGYRFSTADAADAQDSLAVNADPVAPKVSRAHLARTLAGNDALSDAGVAAPTGGGRPARLWDFA